MEGCAEWLVDVLAEAGEPQKPKELVRMAEEAGFSRALLYRARKALAGAVVDTKGRQAPGNRWRLADGE